MGAKGSAEAAAKLNADSWGGLEVCVAKKMNNESMISEHFTLIERT